MGAPSLQGFNLDQTFFGFSPQHQVELHDRLFELVWHGDGRWDWDTVYNLPIHIRRYWISKINKKFEEQLESTDSTTDASAVKSNKTLPRTPYK